jgi:Calcineurin-like phosphoesterase
MRNGLGSSSGNGTAAPDSGGTQDALARVLPPQGAFPDAQELADSTTVAQPDEGIGLVNDDAPSDVSNASNAPKNEDALSVVADVPLPSDGSGLSRDGRLGGNRNDVGVVPRRSDAAYGQPDIIEADVIHAADASASTTDSSDITWTGKEMLGRPTDHSITVKAIASRAVEAYVEYGVTAGNYIGKTANTTYADGFIEADLDGLSANTLYYYRMRYRPAGSLSDFLAGSEYTFNTQRAHTAVFTFAIQSDSHLGYSEFNNPSLYQITMQNIAAAKPDFLLDLGDAVSLDDATETTSTVGTKYLNQRGYFEIPGHSSSIFMVLGNHEREEGWKLGTGTSTATSFPVLGANARKRYFVNPVPDSFYSGNTDAMPEIDGDHLRGDYYAFEWGSALFVAIDPFWYTAKKPYQGAMGGETDIAGEPTGTRWDWTLGQQQYRWLKQTLESSSAPLKFVFSHQEVGGIDDYGRGGALGAKYCEFGGYDTDGTTWSWTTNRQGWDSPVHQLFVQNHVTAFFHGHDHVYAKETLDGVVYQEVPMAANARYDTGFPTNKAQYAGADMIANSGYVRVTVNGPSATVEYVRSFLSSADGTNNSVAASYVLQGSAIFDADGGAGQ